MYATLVLDPVTGTLTCTCLGTPAGVSLSYRLMRHSTVVAASEPTTEVSYRWPRDEQGAAGGDFHAVVTAHLTDGEMVVESEWQYVASTALRESYESWLSSESDEVTIERPALTAAKRPFESIAFIYLSPSSAPVPSRGESVRRIAAETSSKLYTITSTSGPGSSFPAEDFSLINSPGAYVLSGAEPIALPTDDCWAFGSGFAFDRGTLRRGSEVGRSLSSHSEPNAENESLGAPRARFSSLTCGDFAAAIWNSDGSIEFHTDYVGASAWYVYETESTLIVASNYLYATALAAAVGERLELNLSTIDADFTSLTQAFQQPILDELEISGFTSLRPDAVLTVSPNGDRVREPSQLGRDIATPARFTVAKYNELLHRAADELVANCAAIANEPEIETIRCDISGGLDSRMVLAGFLAVRSDPLDKLSLFTESPENAPTSGDMEVAARVSAATGVPFSDKAIDMVGPCTVAGLAQHQIAASFGTYWHRGHSHATVPDPHMVYVGGAGLDNFARDYTTGSWKLVTQPASAPEEISISLAKQVFKWRGRASLKAAPSAGITPAAGDWDDIPGDELDKGAQLFNFYRARFHGGSSVPAALGTLRMSPGPTRSLYLLRLMAARNLAGPRAQIEILQMLNPTLAAVPFVTPHYNETYTALFGAQQDRVADVTQMKEASAARSRDRQWVPCSECTTGGDAGDRSAALIKIARDALHDLGNDARLHELMLPAFKFSSGLLGTTFDMRDSYGKTFVNKILHLHSAWRIVTDLGESNGH